MPAANPIVVTLACAIAAITFAAPEGGTLVVALANSNGYVLATDSRRSSRGVLECHGAQRPYCDDSQKLFPTSNSAAIAIAGFAASGPPGPPPLHLEIASVLRGRFGPNGLLNSNRGVGYNLQHWLRNYLAHALKALVFTRRLGPISDLGMEIIGAEMAAPRARLWRLALEPYALRVPPVNAAVVEFTPQLNELEVVGFTHMTAGVTSFADTVLREGRYDGTDEAIRSYIRSGAGDRDRMSLKSMERLARALLRETAAASKFVGGPDQVARASPDGSFSLDRPEFDRSTTDVARLVLLTGRTFTKADPGGRAGGNAEGVRFVDPGKGPLDEPIAQLISASFVEKVTVRLDGNYFADNVMRDVTLRYGGGSFFFARNQLRSCTLELVDNASAPPAFRKCRLRRVGGQTDAASVVGRELRPTVVGCSTRQPDGSMRFQAGNGCPNSSYVDMPLP